jgi:hypothetical protein
VFSVAYGHDEDQLFLHALFSLATLCPLWFMGTRLYNSPVTTIRPTVFYIWKAIHSTIPTNSKRSLTTYKTQSLTADVVADEGDCK